MELYQAVLLAIFKVPSLVIDAQLQPSRHRAAHTSAEFDINFLKLCSDLSLQFLNGTRLFTINKVFHEPPKKEIWRCKVWGACRPLDRTAAANSLSGKVFIKPLTNKTSIMRWSSIMLEITVLILYPGPKEGLQHIQVNFCSDRSLKEKGSNYP